jgi:predicted DCC family thiol-disulfide oxidoreductase YuxK
MSKGRKRPLVIYDQDCGFCVKWISKINSTIKADIEFKGYQDIRTEFPEVSLASFQSSLKYIDKKGHLSEAGEAVCNLFTHMSLPFRLVTYSYKTIPGFKPLFEWGYRLVASNRSFLSRFTHD